ncbi:UPF0481 protein At3g47200-like [Carya illinoinensis]|uniref:Uncharacterized protein n=1 Tax=Carya illinoinensis TaxID=32201 RepID=A0A8T1QZS3_CARIL|nr:UPF0481 protein At3g47200-like [Carya illinoinensis]KAG6660056.1 hypothetical protein CIPAW_03G078700 [Carya illinoinensis]
MAGTREHVISVEELLSRKASLSGETSRDRDISCLQRRVVEVIEHGEEACELKKKRFEKLSQAGDHPNGGQKATPKIQKVPLLLQDHNHFDKYFKPRIVALGPIHHDTPKYQPAEEYKLRMTNCFVKESGKDAVSLYNVVENNIKQLRQCFDEKVTEKYSDQDLAWMLFVDGCAILQSIHCAVSNTCKDWKMKYDLMAFGTQDLFLLENQLPYKLLEDLMNSSTKKDELEKCINEFINMQASTPKAGTKETRMPLRWPGFLGKRKSHGPDAGEQNKMDDKIKSKAVLVDEEGTTERDPNHLLDLLRTRIIGAKPKRSTSGDKKGTLRSCRNVEELRAAGIQVKSWEGADSLIEIRFNKFLYAGHLWLSPIMVDDSMGPKFLNLIAYEMCPDFYNDFEITSYISFLDSLIDNTNDVMELRIAGILQNHLGSDKEVARLFNEIGTDLVPDADAYATVDADIQSHYDTPWKTWIAQGIHDHFRSPWTVLAFSAAIIALGLTFIQTWFAFKEDRGNSRPRPVRR